MARSTVLCEPGSRQKESHAKAGPFNVAFPWQGSWRSRRPPWSRRALPLAAMNGLQTGSCGLPRRQARFRKHGPGRYSTDLHGDRQLPRGDAGMDRGLRDTSLAGGGTSIARGRLRRWQLTSCCSAEDPAGVAGGTGKGRPHALKARCDPTAHSRLGIFRIWRAAVDHA
jgi:hypothetical protein